MGLRGLLPLGSLVLKKTISTTLRKEVGNRPHFHDGFIDQTNHLLSTNIQRRKYGQSTDGKIPPLNRDELLQIAGGACIFGLLRRARSESRKNEIRMQEFEDKMQVIRESNKESDMLRILREMMMIESLQGGFRCLQVAAATQLKKWSPRIQQHNNMQHMKLSVPSQFRDRSFLDAFSIEFPSP